jgi:hypothetical protein
MKLMLRRGASILRRMAQSLSGKADIQRQAEPAAWMSGHENLAQFDAVGQKLLGDQKYQELLKKAGGIIVPDTTFDEIWRTF